MLFSASTQVEYRVQALRANCLCSTGNLEFFPFISMQTGNSSRSLENTVVPWKVSEPFLWDCSAEWAWDLPVALLNPTSLLDAWNWLHPWKAPTPLWTTRKAAVSRSPVIVLMLIFPHCLSSCFLGLQSLIGCNKRWGGVQLCVCVEDW